MSKKVKIIGALVAIYLVAALGIGAWLQYGKVNSTANQQGVGDGTQQDGNIASGDIENAINNAFGGNDNVPATNGLGASNLTPDSLVQSEYHNYIMYADPNMSDTYITSDDVIITEADKVDFITRFSLPYLQRMSAEDAEKYMADIQVLKRIEVLGIDVSRMLVPEYEWKELYNKSIHTVEEAVRLGDRECVYFRGCLASELNSFLQENAGKTVVLDTQVIVLDETINLVSDTNILGNETALCSVIASQGLYPEVLLSRSDDETSNESSNEAVSDDKVADNTEAKATELDETIVPYALLADKVKNIEISGLKLIDGFDEGIYVIESENILIYNNELAGATYKAICVMGTCNYINIVNNAIHDNNNGAVFVDGSCGYSIIQGNYIFNNRGTRNLTAGLVFSAMTIEDIYTPYNPFPDEHLYDQLDAPHHNIIMNNTIEENFSSGFYCDGGYMNYILGNKIIENEKEGMCLDYGSFGNYLKGNTFKGNGDRNRQTDADLEADFVLGVGRLENGASPFKLPGLSLDNAAYNIVYANTVIDNSGSGIKVVRSAYRNIILENIVDNNNQGVNEKFHGFGIELGFAEEPDEPVIGLDFTAAYENIIARNVISGPHFSAIFMKGSYCNDLLDNVMLDAQEFSVENHSEYFNGNAGNTTNVGTLDYVLN